jgi:hypothetical protein
MLYQRNTLTVDSVTCRLMKILNTAELHLSGETGTVKHPDMQKIRLIGYFLVKMVVCISAVTIYSMYPRLNLSTTPNLQFYKP